MRNLATVCEILNIQPIPEADRIEVATVKGWTVVVLKSELYKVGDLVVYVEIDSILPDRPEFEFMRERKFRIRTIKLKKQVSQGIIFPLSILKKSNYKENDDVTDELGIIKYDPEGDKEKLLLQTKAKTSKNPIIKFLMKFAWFRKIYIKPNVRKGGFPSWIVKTDEERIQNKTKMFETERDLGTKFMVTEKIDGQSATYYLERKGKKHEFGVCSRNIHLKKEDNSSYWTIAKQLNIEDVLHKLIGGANKIVLQGEILGTGIQGNKYKIDGYEFYAFNLIYPSGKMNTVMMSNLLSVFDIQSVCVLENEFTLLDTIPDMVEYAKGNSVMLPIKREGLVLRNIVRNISFKVINPDFLLANEKD